MKMLSIWFQAIRPKTLSAAVVPVLVGTALVATTGNPPNLWLMALILSSALFIQIATNLVNDVLDFRKGADTAERIGPRRVTQSGLISERQVVKGAAVAFLGAVICGAPLVWIGGWTILLIGLVSLFLAYAYTGGPFPLAYLGLGDLFVILFFGLVAVSGTYFLQTHTWALDALVAGLQVGMLATVLIAVNNLRDVEQDIKANKKTLPVRFGQKFARYEILGLLLLSFLLCGYWWMVGSHLAALLPIVAWPFAYAVLRGVFTYPPGPVYNKLLGQAALTHIVFGLGLAIGLVWS